MVRAIQAANRIHRKTYIWGGGHLSFKARGYDCSGAVSYVLHAAGVLSSPLVSGQLAFWGVPGPGAWITVFANKVHTYMYIAGLRYDTSPRGETVRPGPRPPLALHPAHRNWLRRAPLRRPLALPRRLRDLCE